MLDQVNSVVKISEKYQPLFDIPLAKEKAKNEPDNKYWVSLSKVSIIIMTGGRYSVKSFAKSLAEVVWCSDYNYNILSTRYTNTSLEDSVIPDTKEKIEILNLDDEFHVVKNRAIHEPSGSKIVFKGIKTGSKSQTANLKSLKDFTAWWVEEAEEHDSFKDWETSYLSIRDHTKQVVSGLVLNPASKEHWVYKEFFENRGVQGGFNGIKDEVLYIHTTYKDCPREFIPDNIYNYFERLKLTNPVKYNHIVLGGWLDAAEGVVFNDWEYGQFDESLPYGYGMDFGFFPDPDVLPKVAIDSKRKRIYVKQVLKKNNAGVDELAESIINNADLNKTIIADCAEPRLISDLKAKGVRNIKPVQKGSGSVLAGIKLMQDYKIIVDPDSTDIGKELNNYVWSDKKNGVPVDAYNHWIDAIRYYVSTFARNNSINDHYDDIEFS